MKFKCVQTFSLEYLQNCRRMTPYEILQFLDDFHQLHTSSSLNLISEESQKGVNPIRESYNGKVIENRSK
ncbi:MAG: hypothetical protein OXK80_06030 [Bdellovibrionales bacterium]|nr:hypothetical protein [Bdellovibrionales bacterium]